MLSSIRLRAVAVAVRRDVVDDVDVLGGPHAVEDPAGAVERQRAGMVALDQRELLGGRVDPVDRAVGNLDLRVGGRDGARDDSRVRGGLRARV